MHPITEIPFPKDLHSISMEEERNAENRQRLREYVEKLMLTKEGDKAIKDLRNELVVGIQTKSRMHDTQEDTQIKSMIARSMFLDDVAVCLITELLLAITKEKIK